VNVRVNRLLRLTSFLPLTNCWRHCTSFLFDISYPSLHLWFMLVQALLPQSFNLCLSMFTEDFPLVLFDYLEDFLVSWDRGGLYHRCHIWVRKIIQVTLVIIEGILRGCWVLRLCLELVSEEEYLDVANQKLFGYPLAANLRRLPLVTYLALMLRIYTLNVTWDDFLHGLTLLLNLGFSIHQLLHSTFPEVSRHDIHCIAPGGWRDLCVLPNGLETHQHAIGAGYLLPTMLIVLPFVLVWVVWIEVDFKLRDLGLQPL